MPIMPHKEMHQKNRFQRTEQRCEERGVHCLALGGQGGVGHPPLLQLGLVNLPRGRQLPRNPAGRPDVWVDLMDSLCTHKHVAWVLHDYRGMQAR